MPTLWLVREGNTGDDAIGKSSTGTAESQTLSMHRNSNRENREIPEVSAHEEAERADNQAWVTSAMHAAGKSDESVVPTKLANNVSAEPLRDAGAAESVEGRDSRTGNAQRANLDRAQPRKQRSSGLLGIRERAAKDRNAQFSMRSGWEITSSYVIKRRNVNWILDVSSIRIPTIVFLDDLREEPYEVVLHVRICAGGRPQGRSLPRPWHSSVGDAPCSASARLGERGTSVPYT